MKILFLAAFFLPLLLTGQSVNWLTIEEAVKKSQEQPKKLFVDVYTDWCGWCKRMDNNTFKDPEVVEYLNNHFYAVKLDGEEPDTISIDGKDYINPNPGGRRSYHQLPQLFLQGRMAFPSFVFFTHELQTVMVARGYQQPEQLLLMLRFIHEEHYQRQDWESFQEEEQSEDS